MECEKVSAIFFHIFTPAKKILCQIITEFSTLFTRNNHHWENIEINKEYRYYDFANTSDRLFR